MATTQSPTDLLASLQAAQTSQPLSILHLAEPILESQQNAPQQQPNRPSDASTSQPQLTPSTLAADLQHYRDLFSKLRFSYLEQVTKEKYLRSIVGDPPLLVTPAENAELEQKLVVMKGELKEKKVECDALVLEMETLAREVAGKYESVQGKMGQLETLPSEIERLQMEADEIKRQLAEKREALGAKNEGENPRMQMGLEATRAALEARREENRRLDEEIEELKRQMPAKMRECEKTERELEELERRRNEVTRQAREVKRIREEGGRDHIGERGKWYRAQETVMKGLLEI
jgi:myosin heavy subunit